jgi:hypothetical protein
MLHIGCGILKEMELLITSKSDYQLDNAGLAVC